MAATAGRPLLQSSGLPAWLTAGQRHASPRGVHSTLGPRLPECQRAQERGLSCGGAWSGTCPAPSRAAAPETDSDVTKRLPCQERSIQRWSLGQAFYLLFKEEKHLGILCSQRHVVRIGTNVNRHQKSRFFTCVLITLGETNRSLNTTTSKLHGVEHTHVVALP